MTTHTNTSMAYLDAKSKSIVWAAYAEHFAGEEILEEGFNINSGYVYIALENGVTIASAFGQDSEFIIYDEENDEEKFFSTYDELSFFI